MKICGDLARQLEMYRRNLVRDCDVISRPYFMFLMVPAMVEPLRQTLSSYLGHFKNADTFHLVQALWHRHAWLAEYFIQDDGALHDRFRYRGVFRSLRAQIHFFRSRLSDEAVFLVRVGEFYELFGDDARTVGMALGLRLVEMRRGIACVAGFPEWMRDRYVERILAAGKNLAVIEKNRPGEFVAERYVNEIFREGVCHA